MNLIQKFINAVFGITDNIEDYQESDFYTDDSTGIEFNEVKDMCHYLDLNSFNNHIVYMNPNDAEKIDIDYEIQIIPTEYCEQGKAVVANIDDLKRIGIL